MAEDKPRLARLTSILTQLQSKQLLTARELAEKHQVSIRTVYRDIRTLEQSGVPVVSVEGRGFSLMEGYRMPPVMFSEAEANALVTAEQIINNNTDASLKESFASAMQKIKAVLQFPQKEKTERLVQRMHIRNYPDANEGSRVLAEIQLAIVEYRLVKIRYHSLQNAESVREIEPFALVQTKENWLLIAFCRLRDDFRMFRLDCIREMIPLHTHFEAHKISLREYFEEEKKQWS